MTTTTRSERARAATRRPRRARLPRLLAAAVAVLAASAPGRARGDAEDDLRLALDLVDRGLHAPALALLAAQKTPAHLERDTAVAKGRALAQAARSEKDDAKREKLREEARRLLEKAQKDGSSAAAGPLEALKKGQADLVLPVDAAKDLPLADRLLLRGLADAADAVIDRTLADVAIDDVAKARGMLLHADAHALRALSPVLPVENRRASLGLAREIYAKHAERAPSLDVAFDARAGLYEALVAWAIGLGELCQSATDPAVQASLKKEMREAWALAEETLEKDGTRLWDLFHKTAADDAERPAIDQGAYLCSYFFPKALVAHATALAEGEERTKLLKRAIEHTWKHQFALGPRLLGLHAAIELGAAYEASGATGDATAAYETALDVATFYDKDPLRPDPARRLALPPAALDVLARASLALGKLRLADRDTKAARVLFERPFSHDKKYASQPLGKALAAAIADAKARDANKTDPPPPPEPGASSDVRIRSAARGGGVSLLDLLGTGESEGAGGGALYAARFARRRAAPRGGPTVASESAVEAGLRWLARHQHDDGRWDARAFADLCSKASCDARLDDRGKGEYTTGTTALALLAFLGAGTLPQSIARADDPITGKSVSHGEVVRKGLAWLVSRQDAEGAIGPKSSAMLYNHAMATIALAEAYAMTRSVAYRIPAQKAVNYVHGAQNYGLGWGYTYKCGKNDTSVTGWCLQAIKTAQAAGLEVANASVEGAKSWLARVTDSNGWVGYDRMGSNDVIIKGKNEAWLVHPTMTAVGLLARTLIDRPIDRKGELFSKGPKYVGDDLPKWDPQAVHPTNDAYYWFYGAHALFLVDGPQGARWKKWNEALHKALLQNQRFRKDGCLDGSWDAGGADRWASAGGRVYVTAMSLLALEAPYRTIGAAEMTRPR